jgi:dTDP-4-amino-4,6-dideoxygalactose transaminase
LAKLEKYIENKRINWQQYNSLIESEDIIFLDFKNNETPWFFDVVFSSVEEKNNIIESLRKNNIETRNSYPALSLQNYLEKYKKTELTYSESISDRILWLPSSNNLKSTEITKIANIINSSI